VRAAGRRRVARGTRLSPRAGHRKVRGDQGKARGDLGKVRWRDRMLRRRGPRRGARSGSERCGLPLFDLVFLKNLE
jgi:transposase